MPIIIDNNRSGDFSDKLQGHADLIISLTRGRKTKICVGGHLLRELMGTRIRALIQEWGRVGVLHRVDDDLADNEEHSVRQLPIRSDDPHVIALVRLTGCNVVYTDDTDLIKDLKNPAVSLQRRKVITSRTQARIAKSLMKNFGCP